MKPDITLLEALMLHRVFGYILTPAGPLHLTKVKMDGATVWQTRQEWELRPRWRYSARLKG